MIYITIILFLIAALFLYSVVLHKKYNLPLKTDEIHFIATPDNTRIALFRYKPKGGLAPKGTVLFCHGLGANMRNFDMTEEYSPARYMANNGYDSWILNLRGANVKGVIEYKNWDFDFDDYLKKDIPSAVKYILDSTSERQIYWIGHSMGGMLLYAYLLAGGDKFIKAGITLGSPVKFSSSNKTLTKLLGLRFFLKFTAKVHFDKFARFLAPFAGLFNTPLMKYQMNVRNVDFELIRKAQYNAITPISTKLLAQFAEWFGKDEVVLSDGFSVTENLNKISAPLLIISGGNDMLSPADDTVYAYEQIQSMDKSYIELAKKNGFSQDYGHIDMIFGKEALKEVYPLIKQWLDSLAYLPTSTHPAQ